MKDLQVVSAVEAQLNTHEAVCAQRYAGIEGQFRSSNARLKRIETIMIGSAVAVISGFGAIIMMLFQLLAK
jgi:hypothetical protein